MNIIRNHLLHSALADPAKFTGRVWRTDSLEAADDHSLAGSGGGTTWRDEFNESDYLR
jgi:hypothetical protein